MNSMVITKDGADVKDTIKAVAKALEDQKVLDKLIEEADTPKQSVYLAALAFSYLEPASKLINKKVNAALKTLGTKYGFVDLNTFSKAAAGGGAAKAKATISASNAKIRRA